MAEVERLTTTMPSELATVIKAAVAEGDYASTSEVVREVLREWKIKRRSGTRKSAKADMRKARLISRQAG